MKKWVFASLMISMRFVCPGAPSFGFVSGYEGYERWFGSFSELAFSVYLPTLLYLHRLMVES